MLDAPVDIDGRDALGQTALWQACRDGFEDVAPCYRSAALLPNGRTRAAPREIAELHGHAAVIATFDEAGHAPRASRPSRRLRRRAARRPGAGPLLRLGPRRALESGFVRSPVFDD